MRANRSMRNWNGQYNINIMISWPLKSTVAHKPPLIFSISVDFRTPMSSCKPLFLHYSLNGLSMLRPPFLDYFCPTFIWYPCNITQYILIHKIANDQIKQRFYLKFDCQIHSLNKRNDQRIHIHQIAINKYEIIRY